MSFGLRLPRLVGALDLPLFGSCFQCLYLDILLSCTRLKWGQRPMMLRNGEGHGQPRPALSSIPPESHCGCTTMTGTLSAPPCRDPSWLQSTSTTKWRFRLLQPCHCHPFLACSARAAY
ncbi:hypothetical protein AMECASPLE_009267 [Ameca splendens]|uniref:Secreted protein n=1 Tax=Ameca splendens TaxID=208324 RepID=A0ABV0Y0F4_9TELE